MREDDNTVALVTGSSRGLGRAIALALGRAGCRVAIHYRQEKEAAESLARDLKGFGSESAAFAADLCEPDAADRLFGEAIGVFGRVDILVHNATPPIRRQHLDSWSWSDFEPYLHLYLRSGFRLAQLAAEGMKDRRFGRLIFIGSSAALHRPPPELLPYVCAKSAVAGMVRALAVELGPFNVTVNQVVPSLLVTDQTAAIGDRARQMAAARAPMKRLAALDEVAQAVVYLASDSAGFITGSTVPVTGGEEMS